MLRRTNPLPILAAILLLHPIASCPPAFGQDDQPVFRATTRLVILHATVVDRNGNLVTALSRALFPLLRGTGKRSALG